MKCRELDQKKGTTPITTADEEYKCLKDPAKYNQDQSKSNAANDQQQTQDNQKKSH